MTPAQEAQERLRRALLNDEFPDDQAFADSPFARAVPDRLGFERNTAVSAWMSQATGRNITAGSGTWQAEKDALAKGFFKMSTAKGISDQEIHGLIRQHIQTAEEAALEGMNAALAGQSAFTIAGPFGAKGGASKLRAKWPEYTQELVKAHGATAARVGHYRQLIDESAAALNKDMEAAMPLTKSFKAVADKLLGIPAKDRRIVVKAIAATGAKTPEEQRSYLGKLGAAFGRMTEGLGSSAESGLMSMLYAGGVSESLTAGDIPQAEVMMEEGRKNRDYYLLANMVRQVADSDISPLEVEGMAAETGLAVSRMAPMMAVSMVPYLGAATLGSYYRDDTAASLMLEYEGMDSSTADLIALPAAPIMAAAEHVSNLVPIGRLPYLGKFLKSGITSAKAGLLRAGGLVAGGTGIEVIEEGIQQITPRLVQDLYNAVGLDVPDVNWADERKKLAELPAQVVAPAFVVSLVGGGVVSINDVKHGRALASDRDLLVASGYSPSVADKIVAEATANNWQAVDGLMAESFDTKQGGISGATDTERKAALSSLISKTEQATQDVTERMRAAEVSIRRTADAWEVSTPDGTATFGDWENAYLAAASEMERQEMTRDEQTLKVFEVFSQQAKEGEQFTISDEALSLADAEADALGRGDQTNVDAIWNRLEVERARLGRDDIGLADMRVFGRSSIEAKEGIKTYASRIYEGGQAIDLVEEKAESDVKRWINQGRTSLTSLADSIRQVEQATGDTYLHGDTDTAVIEAYSALARLYTTGTRKGNEVSGAIRKQEADVIRGQRKRLQAAKEKAPGLLAKLQETLEFFKQVLRQAARLMKAKKEGKLGNIEQFLNESLGLSEEAAHVEAVTHEVQDMAEGIARNRELLAKARDTLAGKGGKLPDSLRQSFGVANLAGDTFSIGMASDSGAAQSNDASPGGLTVEEFNRLEEEYQEVREADKGQSGFWMSGPFWHVTNYTYSADSSYVTYRNILGVEHQFRISNHEKPPGHATDRYFRLQYIGSNNTQFRAEARKWIATRVKASPDLNLATTQDVVREWHNEQISSIEHSLEKAQERLEKESNRIEELTKRLAAKEKAFSDGIRIGNGKPFTTENQREQAAASIEETRFQLEEEKSTNAANLEKIQAEVNAILKELDLALKAKERLSDVSFIAETGITSPGRGPKGAVSAKTSSGSQGILTITEEIKNTKTENGVNSNFNPSRAEGGTSYSIGLSDRLDALSAALGEQTKAKPEARRAMMQRAQDRLAGARVVWERIDRGAKDLARTVSDTPDRYGAELAQLRADFDADMAEIRTERETEVGGARQDKAGKEAVNRIKAEYATQLERRRLRYERDRRAIEDKQTAEESAQAKEQGRVSKAEITAAMRALDAVVSVLPPEIRGKVGGFIKLSELTTTAQRIDEIERRFEKVGELLEKHFKNELTEQFQELLKKARTDGAGGEKVRGKIGVEAHRWFAQVEPISAMSQDDVTAEMAKQEEIISNSERSTDEQEAALETWTLLHQFGAWEDKSASEMDTGLRMAEAVYKRGRDAWKTILAGRKAERETLRATALKELGGRASWASLQHSQGKQAKSGQRSKVGEWFYRHGSFQQILTDLFGRGEIASRYEDKAREATRKKTDAMRQRISEYRDAMLLATGAKTWRVAQKKLLSLQTRDQNAPVTFYGNPTSKTVEIPAEKLADILEGNLDPKTFGLNQSDVDILADEWAANKTNKQIFTIEKATPGQAIKDTELSQLEAVHFTMLARQEQYRKAMERHGITADTLEQAEAWLTPEAKAVRSWLFEQYTKGYGSLNQVYQRMFGADLPQVREYAPGYWESDNKATDLDPFGAGVEAAGMAAGFLKKRKVHLARPRQLDAMQAYWQHVQQVEHWKAWAELMSEMRSVLGNRDVLTAIEAKAGSGARADVIWWMDALEQNGVRDAQGNDMLQKIMRAQARIALAYKVSVILKQLPAALGSLADVSAGGWINGARRVLTGQSAASLADMWKSDAIQRRVESGYSPEMRAAMRGPTAKPDVLGDAIEWGMQGISLADAAFTSFSGAVAYDYHYREALKTGANEQQAAQIAMEQTENTIGRTAQPGELMDRSRKEIEIQGLGKLMFMFQSAQRQAWSLVYFSTRGAIKGDVSKAEWGRVVFTHFVLMPAITQTMAGLVRYLFTDDDAEEAWSPQDYLTAMALGPTSGIMIFGAALDVMSQWGGMGPRNSNPISNALGSLLNKAGKDEWTVNDIGQMAADASLLSSGVVNPSIEALGVTWNVLKQILGISENVMEGK